MIILARSLGRAGCGIMVGTSTTDFTVLPADYFRHILTGTKIQCKWVVLNQKSSGQWSHHYSLTAQFFSIGNQNYRRHLFLKFLLKHDHDVVVMAIKLGLNL